MALGGTKVNEVKYFRNNKKLSNEILNKKTYSQHKITDLLHTISNLN